MTRIPLVIDKLAYTVAQHRKIVKHLSKPLRKEKSQFKYLQDNVEVGNDTINPIYEYMHELGHKADMALSRKGDLYYGDNNRIKRNISKKEISGALASLVGNGVEGGHEADIMQEIAANRMAARVLLNTGSPISEVKDYVRKMSPYLNSYKIGNIARKLDDKGLWDKTVDRVVARSNKAVMTTKGEGNISQKEYENIMGKAKIKLEHYAKLKKQNLVMSPGYEAKTPIDIDYLPKDVQKTIKANERDTVENIFTEKINRYRTRYVR